VQLSIAFAVNRLKLYFLFMSDTTNTTANVPDVMARKSHPHHYSARVGDAEKTVLADIQRLYGDGNNPSAIASTLLRHAARVGPKHFMLFMRQVAHLSEGLATNGRENMR
jgi:hypothetical protein